MGGSLTDGVGMGLHNQVGGIIVNAGLGRGLAQRGLV